MTGIAELIRSAINVKSLEGRITYTHFEKPKKVIRNLTRELSPCDGCFIRPDVNRELQRIIPGPLELSSDPTTN